MTLEQLQEKAYYIATANTMTESFDYYEFQEINCTDYAWEPLEDFDERSYTDLVTSIADAIIRDFKHLVADDDPRTVWGLRHHT